MRIGLSSDSAFCLFSDPCESNPCPAGETCKCVRGDEDAFNCV